MASQLRSERGMGGGGMCSSVTECRVNYARPVLQSSLEARWLRGTLGITHHVFSPWVKMHTDHSSWLCWRLWMLKAEASEARGTCFLICVKWLGGGKNHPEVTEIIMKVCLELTKNAFDGHKANTAVLLWVGTRQVPQVKIQQQWYSMSALSRQHRTRSARHHLLS